MIIYDNSSPSLIFSCRGSNLPRAFRYSLPSVGLAVLTHYLLEEYSDHLGIIENFSFSASWSASVIVLSVLLSMRTAKAYDRFWEGITLVHLMRAEWFETASNLIAFSHVALKKDPTDTKVVNEVKTFQFTLVRLMSLMQGKALRSIGGHEEEFEVLDIQALDGKSLSYLKGCEAREVDPVEIVLHWIQVLVTDAHIGGQIPVPPPILTRVFQTLSRGMVNCHNARKLADVPFPYPLSQMVFLLLFLQSVMTPLIFAATFRDPVYAAVVTLLPLLGMWSITFTAGELEQPFGNDPNDLPLSSIQRHYNMSLMMLLDKETFKASALLDTSPLTVNALRKKHTKNVETETSMTDSLPAWLRISRLNSRNSSITYGSASGSVKAVEMPDQSAHMFQSGVSSKQSIGSEKALTMTCNSESALSASATLCDSQRLDVDCTLDQIWKELSTHEIDRLRKEIEEPSVHNTTSHENLAPRNRSIGVTSRIVSLGGVEFANGEVQDGIDLGTHSLLKGSIGGCHHDCRAVVSLGEVSELHATPKLLGPRVIGNCGESSTRNGNGSKIVFSLGDPSTAVTQTGLLVRISDTQ